MIPQHKQSEGFRCAVDRAWVRDQARGSTDPQWVREQLGQPEQFSRAFVIVAALVGALAFYGVFAAIASI